MASSTGACADQCSCTDITQADYDLKYAPWEASAFDDANPRKTLTLRLPKILDEPFERMESCLGHEVFAESVRFFGRKLSEEDVLTMYKSITKKTGEYPRQLRVKINTTGFHSIRYWDAGRARIDAPEIHAGKVYNAKVALRALWVAPEAWGLVCDATDLQEQEDRATFECPF